GPHQGRRTQGAGGGCPAPGSHWSRPSQRAGTGLCCGPVIGRGTVMMHAYWQYLWQHYLAGLRFQQVSSRTEAFMRDGHRTVLEQEARGARILLWLSLITVAALVAWAAVSPIDEVVRVDGTVVPSRRIQ